ncbi:T9SS type B sorting domain-containing protein [Maribacter aestuarii]|uniref:T9SS type B sorting domain-containing protein n=1 Tax=Maribacter aestuarii TaxID=1130723 RepID=UPI00248C40FA|nr:T9SS type B sorting domain-containing protein [Maribacter aestuarii]
MNAVDIKEMSAIQKFRLFLLIFPCVLPFLVTGQTGCTTLNTPLDGATNVAVTTNLQWMPAPNAVGYRVTVGTTSGGSDILNLEDVGNTTDYTFATPLDGLTTYYVTITPRTNTGNITNCEEESFTTRAEGFPGCTEIINPFNGDMLVSTTANITWIRDFSATGYLMTVYERDPNGILILDRVDVGNGTNYKPPDFKPRTRYYVTIIPYNDIGAAMGCSPITFVTGDGPPLPDCTAIGDPIPDETGIIRDPLLEWDDVNGADGYILSIGTTQNGDELFSGDVGNIQSFQTDGLPSNTRIYVRITPYDGELLAESCPTVSFTNIIMNNNTFNGLVPKFFTPNNDGFNDYWSVSSTDMVVVESILIFNRYGKLLQQLLPDQKWDGTHNGSALPSDSYWYLVKTAEKNSIKGFFALKR